MLIVDSNTPSISSLTTLYNSWNVADDDDDDDDEEDDDEDDEDDDGLLFFISSISGIYGFFPPRSVGHVGHNKPVCLA